jgi:hypothetical protein
VVTLIVPITTILPPPENTPTLLPIPTVPV